MGTMSSVAIIHKDGTVESTTCNSDGHYYYNGSILYIHYRDALKVKELISLGEMSILAPEVTAPHGISHNFERPTKGVTIFYGRDRGESNVQSQKCASIKEYLSFNNFLGYDYVFHEKRNKWYVVDEKTKKLVALSSVLMKQISKAPVLYEAQELIKKEKWAKKLEKELPNKDEVSNKRYKL